VRLEADNQTIAWMVWNDARAHYQALPYANFAPSPQITKRVETGSLTDVSLGERVTYTIVISNSGDLIANQVVVTDPLPTAVTLGGADRGFGVDTPARQRLPVGTIRRRQPHSIHHRLYGHRHR